MSPINWCLLRRDIAVKVQNKESVKSSKFYVIVHYFYNCILSDAGHCCIQSWTVNAQEVCSQSQLAFVLA